MTIELEAKERNGIPSNDGFKRNRPEASVAKSGGS